jgi:hypothetical protein
MSDEALHDPVCLQVGTQIPCLFTCDRDEQVMSVDVGRVLCTCVSE